MSFRSRLSYAAFWVAWPCAALARWLVGLRIARRIDAEREGEA